MANDALIAPRFKPGDFVRVSERNVRGHIRTPAYIMGKSGLILRLHGRFRNPESTAYGGDGMPPMPLYLVQFRQQTVWSNYIGNAEDSISVDIFDHWLELA